MPIYTFINKLTGETKDVVQKMNEHHIYSEGGVVWDRIFDVPEANIAASIDPFSSRDFIQKTKERSGTIGDLWDQSAELSEKRARIMGTGVDPVKEKAVSSYEKKTKKPHPFKNGGGPKSTRDFTLR
jgi:hypothetical protein